MALSHIYGCIPLLLHLGLRRKFLWSLVVADVTVSIIGSDFHSFYNILVKLPHRRLVNIITNFTVNGTSVRKHGCQIKVFAWSSRYHAVLQDFPDIMSPSVISWENRHSTVLYILTTPEPPVTLSQLLLVPDRLRIEKSEFEEML
jgi:hypothetical protein